MIKKTPPKINLEAIRQEGKKEVADFVNAHLVGAHASSGPLKLNIDLVQWVKQKEVWGLF